MECKVHAKNEFSLLDNRRYWKSSGGFSCMRVKGKTRERRKDDFFVFFFPSLERRGILGDPAADSGGKGKTPLSGPWSPSMFYFVRS